MTWNLALILCIVLHQVEDKRNQLTRSIPPVCASNDGSGRLSQFVQFNIAQLRRIMRLDSSLNLMTFPNLQQLI